MSKTFFTSDTHFGHQRTLELFKRPFKNVLKMNKTIVNKWNSTIGIDDIVYHLGDFGDVEFVNYLNGKINLVPGNYENQKILDYMAKRNVTILESDYLLKIYEYEFYLIHCPYETKISENNFFLFGHIHKLQMVKINGLNVSVDCHNFSPLSFEDVLFYRNAIINYYDENVFCDKIGWECQKRAG